MKATKTLLALMLLLLMLPASALAAFQEPVHTPEATDFWGALTVKGQPGQPGDQIAAFDSQGNLCGLVTLEAGVAPQFMLHVYGDDVTTHDVDEGGTNGDELTFQVYRASEDKGYVQRVRAHPLATPGYECPDPPTWGPDRASYNMDVEVITGLFHIPNPSPIPFGETMFDSINLDDCLYEPSDAGQVAWSAESQTAHWSCQISNGRVLWVTADAGSTGSGVVEVTGTLGAEGFSQDVVCTIGENHAPQINPHQAALSVNAGSRVEKIFTATDPDGSAVRFILTPQNDYNATLEALPPTSGTYRTKLVYRPDHDQVGPHEFTVTATDEYLADEAEAEITVRRVAGYEPVESWDLHEGQPYDLTVEGTGTVLDGFRICIPRGALPRNVHFTICLIDDDLLPKLPKGAFGYRFRLGPEGLVFNKPVTIFAPCGKKEPPGDNILVYRHGEDVSGWSKGGITDCCHMAEDDLVKFKTTRFSAFTPAATSTAEAAGTDSGGGGGGCFIATAAFGSPLERHVMGLRLFRDRWLLPWGPGKMFVSTYYQLSPAAAGYISRHSGLKPPVRMALYPLFLLACLPENASSAGPLGSAALALTGLGGLMLVRRKRNQRP
jgi:hypothetical protein